jgi:hypothetical protein
MKRTPVLAIVLLLAAAAVTWFFIFKKNEKSGTLDTENTVIQSRHSEELNQSFTGMIEAYYRMSEGFVNWETDTVAKYSLELKSVLDNLNIDELKTDSLTFTKASGEIGNIKAELEGIINDPTLDEKRGSLNIMSKLLFDLLTTIRYDAAKIYYQECPMAFNDDIPGYWLSPTGAVRNPYLGTKHPKYKSGMLKCGGPVDTINFRGISKANP